MKMRAKFTVDMIVPGVGVEQIHFKAKYDPQNSPEDNTYSKYTSSASAVLNITNPSLIGTFNLDDQFYVDFMPIKNI